MQQKLKESEFRANNQAINMEEQEIASERRIQDLMLDKRNLDNKIKKLQNELNAIEKPDDLQMIITS